VSTRAGRSTKVPPEEISYSMVIVSSCKKGAMRETTGWFEEMAASPWKPNVFVFNAVIAGFARNGSSAKAAGWLDRMVAEGLAPNIRSYNAVIDACVQVGDCEGAARWFHAMLESGVLPDVRSFNAVLRGCARRGDVEGAVTWLDQMRTAGPRAVPDEKAYSSAIQSCANARPHKAAEVAERLFQEMREDGLMPSASTLIALGVAVGDGRRDVLCDAHGVSEKTRQELEHARQRRRTQQEGGGGGGHSSRSSPQRRSGRERSMAATGAIDG